MNLSLAFSVRAYTSGVGTTPSSSRIESPIERLIASPGKHESYGGSHVSSRKKTRGGPRSSLFVAAFEIETTFGSSSVKSTIPITPPSFSMRCCSSGRSGVWSTVSWLQSDLPPHPSEPRITRQSPALATSSRRSGPSSTMRTVIAVDPDISESIFVSFLRASWTFTNAFVSGPVAFPTSTPAWRTSGPIAWSCRAISSAMNAEHFPPSFPWPSNTPRRSIPAPSELSA
mmetsp:Transcript_2052/g.4834  ORF Transcript_2052/g.4834 Transcript_2052/m.4834 type:complete len:229 (-) Transcript_2052:697-1383(-)